VSVSPDLDRRFRERAAAAGLLDVAYDLADSPVGLLLVATTDAGLCRIDFDPEPERAVEALGRCFGPRVLRASGPLDEARRELDEYFSGRRQQFELDIDLRPVPAFQRQVLTELGRVPYGRTATYGGLASRVGKPRAARAVGGALNRNPVPIVLPCHRIVGSDGRLVGYGGGLERKRALLALEGITL
jgi:methylated-DNA-[protein]-cysteine S-methyltransferase